MSTKLTTISFAMPVLIFGIANQAVALPVTPGPMFFQGDVDVVSSPGGLVQQPVTSLGTFTANAAFGTATSTLVGGIDPSLSVELDVSSAGSPTGASANGNPIVFQYQFVVHGSPGTASVGFTTDGQISSGALPSGSLSTGSGNITWSVTGVGFTTITDTITCASGASGSACSNSFHDAGSATFNVDQVYTVSMGAQFHAMMFPVGPESLIVKGLIDPMFTAPDGYTIEYSVGLLEGGPTSATPVPAALPMFIGGAGMIGLLARRRNQKRAA